MRPTPPLALGVLMLVVAAGALEADWLVTHDGHRLETAGAWSVEDDLVVFRLVGGTLSSMPADEVDLEASRRLSASGAEDPAAEESTQPAEKREARWVITDEDVTHVSGADTMAPSETEEGEPPATTGSAAAPAEISLEVTSWERREIASPPGIEITGTLRNSAASLAASVSLAVTLRTPDGDELGRVGATLERRSLAPDRDTGFRAFFPDVYDFDSVEFEPQSVALQFGPTSTPPEDETPEG